MINKIFGLLVIATVVFACTQDVVETNNDADLINLQEALTSFEVDNGEFRPKGIVRDCKAMDVLSDKLKQNPSLANKIAVIEKHTQDAISYKKGGNGGGRPGSGGGGGGTDPTPVAGVINIPVVVHVVYANNLENISESQIASQIAVLNQDFNATNSDLNPPSAFAGVVADSDFNFVLDQVIRKQGDRTTWGTNDAVKSFSPVVSPDKKLNIWVAQIGSGILGYAQFPGGSPSTDGIVVSPQFFGNTGYVAAPYDGGRTMTHEVGHYLNLRHIWGDGRCNRDDFVSDTPTSDRPNYGCPSSVTHCRSLDMHMNYMDYVEDDCMFMFTEGQKERMRALFAVGGARESMVQ